MPVNGSRAAAGLLVFVLVGVSCASGSDPDPDPGSDRETTGQNERPNVLIILTDDQHEETLSVMPATRRWLVRRGTKFTNAFVTTPLCCPSRATILSGRYVHNHEVGTGQLKDLEQGSTVQRYLREAGYRTAIFGKLPQVVAASRSEELDERGRPAAGPPAHFDRWAIFSKGMPNGYSGATWNVGGEVRVVDQYSTNYIREQGLRFLRRSEEQDGTPWFLHLSVFAPHIRPVPERAYENAEVPEWKPDPAVLERDRRDKPPFVQRQAHSPDRARIIRRNQLRTLMSVDDLVKRVMRELVDLGEDGRTLVFFLSDNGFLWGDHGLRGKSVPYTRSVRVPFLMRWPGRVTQGVRDDRLIANVDIPSTILDVAGIRPDPRYPQDGRSLFDERNRNRDRVLLEYWGGTPDHPPTWASTRTRAYQYVEYYDNQGTVIFREYYDLDDDPWQLKNLLEDGDPSNDPPAGELADLSARLRQDRTCRGTAGQNPCP